MPNWLWRITAHLRGAAHQSLRYAESNIVTMAAVTSGAFLLYYLVYTFIIYQAFESPTLRLLAAVIALPLIFAKRWPEPLRPYMHWYWCFTITYCLPFFFTYMLLRTTDFEVALAHRSMLWPMSEVIALVLLIMFMIDGALIAVTFIVGTAAAWALYLSTTTSFNWSGIKDVYLNYMPTYLFILIAGTIYNRSRETIQQEMLRAVANVGSNIAHELRTPLLGIKANAQGLKQYLPQLIAAYDLAVEHGLSVKPLRRRQLDSLRETLQRIDNETDYSNTIIDMLLINAGGGVAKSEMRNISALDCVRAAVSRYPWVSDTERQLVQFSEKRDFRLHGSEVLFTHVLFNLIKNALYFIAKSGKGEIFIWLDHAGAFNKMIFMDTGTGIHPSVLPRIFERFFTSQDAGRGSGIGLSFCKSVVESFRGRIECHSHYGEFTRFTLTFPAVDDHE